MSELNRSYIVELENRIRTLDEAYLLQGERIEKLESRDKTVINNEIFDIKKEISELRQKVENINWMGQAKIDNIKSVLKEQLDGEKDTVVSELGENPINVYSHEIATNSKPSRDDDYDPQKEECEHNRPFWECEICGNRRIEKPSEPSDNIYHLTVLINNESDFYSFLKGHEVIDLIKKIEKWQKRADHD